MGGMHNVAGSRSHRRIAGSYCIEGSNGGRGSSSPFTTFVDWRQKGVKTRTALTAATKRGGTKECPLAIAGTACNTVLYVLHTIVSLTVCVHACMRGLNPRKGTESTF